MRKAIDSPVESFELARIAKAVQGSRVDALGDRVARTDSPATRLDDPEGFVSCNGHGSSMDRNVYTCQLLSAFLSTWVALPLPPRTLPNRRHPLSQAGNGGGKVHGG